MESIFTPPALRIPVKKKKRKIRIDVGRKNRVSELEEIVSLFDIVFASVDRSIQCLLDCSVSIFYFLVLSCQVLYYFLLCFSLVSVQ